MFGVLFLNRRDAHWCAVLALTVFAAAYHAQAQDSSPSASLTLADAVARVLQGNPALSAYSYDIRAAEARQIQARLRPNPELSVEIEDIQLGESPRTRVRSRSFGGSLDQRAIAPTVEWSRGSETGPDRAFSESELTISISQIVELGGKRAKRMGLAARDRDTAAWDYEIARANVLDETAKAFVDVLVAQERVKLNDELVTLAEQVLHTVSARVQAGRVSPLEARKAETALAMAGLRAENAKKDLVSARTQLAALWGEPSADFGRAEGVFGDAEDLPGIETIEGRIERNPDLARWNAEIEKREANVVLERAKRVPDVTVSAGFRVRNLPDSRESGWSLGNEGFRYSETRSDADRDWDSLLVLGFSVPLPLFNRNQGGIREAEQLAAKASEERRSVLVNIRAGLVGAYQELSKAHSALETLKADVLPAAAETFASIKAYTQGKFGFLDVLDAQRTLFEAREQYIEALAAYHKSMTTVERLIGEPVREE